MLKNTGSLFKRCIAERKLIDIREKSVSFVQIMGFCLISVGILYFLYLIIFHSADKPFSGDKIAMTFFIIMMGLSLAFPSLLSNKTEGLSTMRIVVFMMINVICMLFLKMGWNASSLAEIKVDWFWTGIIAFVFGTKATQAYFENAKQLIPKPKKKQKATDLTRAEIARLAVIQNRDVLLAKYPNVECISDTLKGADDYLVAIYIKDNKVDSLPDELTATLPDGSEIKIQTEIIPDSGEGTPHIGQATDELSDSNSPTYYGSVCCLVDSLTNPDFKGIVTSGHVFTYGDFFDYGGVLGPAQRRSVLIDGKAQSRLFFQQMKYNQDLAVAEVTDKSDLLSSYISFKNGFYEISDSDLMTTSPEITIVSRQNNVRDAFVLDYNVSFEIKYFNSPRYIRNIILIGSTNNRATSLAVSSGGDSGSCVYHKKSGKLIGMLLGGNNKFSFVLPLKETLSAFNFIPL